MISASSGPHFFARLLLLPLPPLLLLLPLRLLLAPLLRPLLLLSARLLRPRPRFGGSGSSSLFGSLFAFAVVLVVAFRDLLEGEAGDCATSSTVLNAALMSSTISPGRPRSDVRFTRRDLDGNEGRGTVNMQPMGAVNMQPVSPGPVVARIWEIYRAQAPVLLGTAAILFVLQFVAFLLVGGVAGIAISILFWVLATVYQGMVVELVQDVQDGRRDHSVGQLLVSVEPVLLRLIAVSILLAIGVGLGFVLLIIPGLILLTIWAVVAPVTVLERPGVFAAFGRSRELVRGNGWGVFGVIVIMYLVVLVISIAAGAASSPLGTVGRGLVNWAVTVVVAPLPALSASVLYFALRPRAPMSESQAPVSLG